MLLLWENENKMFSTDLIFHFLKLGDTQERERNKNEERRLRCTDFYSENPSKNYLEVTSYQHNV